MLVRIQAQMHANTDEETNGIHITAVLINGRVGERTTKYQMIPRTKAAMPEKIVKTQAGIMPAINTNSNEIRILNTIAHPGRHINVIGKNNAEINR